MPVRKLGLMYSLMSPSISPRMAVSSNPNVSSVALRFPSSVTLSIAVFHRPLNAMPVSMDVFARTSSRIGMTSSTSRTMRSLTMSPWRMVATASAAHAGGFSDPA